MPPLGYDGIETLDGDDKGTQRMNNIQKTVTPIVLLAACCNTQTRASGPESEPAQAQSVKIQVLSTMLADRGVGEWGFAALVEVDGTRLLFDAGGRQHIVAKNAQTLSADLTDITHVVLSHHHGQRCIGHARPNRQGAMAAGEGGHRLLPGKCHRSRRHPRVQRRRSAK